MPLVLRQEGHQSTADQVFLKRIDGTPIATAVVPEEVTVKLVQSTLRHGVDDAARGAAVFGGIVGSIDLEFLDTGLAG